ncbi:hypothetical protein ACFLVK_01880 [Chloroflexota bacterium]
MRKYVGIAVTLVAIVSLVFIPVASAQPASVDYTDTPEYDQIKVAQVPLPWQFWAYEINDDGTVTIIDRIRISPTWEIPPIEPPGLPPGEGTILVRRWSAVAPNAIELEDLLWEFEEVNNEMEPLPTPPLLPPNLRWEQEELDPIPVVEGEDLELDITLPAGSEAEAVLVAYEVIRETEDGTQEVVGHFLNEAVLNLPLPDPSVSPIVEVRVNFDIHNDTDYAVTNFELDFQGLEFSGDDITGAVGFKVGGGRWGANPQNPLIVRPIEIKVADPDNPGETKTIKGTEVKWVEPCHPLVKSDWLHIGLSFTLTEWIESVNATVQGYWTIIPPTPPKVWCIETENPHGKNVPPAGKTTLPGSKGGQNEDGFYQLFAKNRPCPDTYSDPPEIFITWKGADATDPNQRFGPFASGDRVKITQAPGAPPSSKPIGSSKGQAGAVKAHITIPSDAIVYAVDAAGNMSQCVECLVPPPPK